MAWIALWLMMGAVVAVIANGKGFAPVPWFLYGAALWPVALAHVLVKPRLAGSEEPPLARHVDMAAMIDREKAEALTREGKPISDALARERAERKLWQMARRR